MIEYMPCTIRRWDGKVVQGARSTGSGVFAAFDWRDMVLHPGIPIEKKAGTDSGRIRDFAPADHAALTAVLGRYSKVQSINSEDSVTWSVFGALSPDVWLDELLTEAFGSGAPTTWALKFWERIAHPQVGSVRNGPEADVVMVSPKRSVVCEAKWNADLGGDQGVNKDMSQLQMRAYAAERCCPAGGEWKVLVLALSPTRYKHLQSGVSNFGRYFEADRDGYRPKANAQALQCAAVTWNQVLRVLRRHPSHAEAAAYLEWRLALVS